MRAPTVSSLLSLLYRIARPLLFALDAETVHHRAIHSGAWVGRHAILCDLLRVLFEVRDPRLEVACLGMRFPAPLGLAAGFDKNGQLLHLLRALGFGFAEVGTVTPRPWPGNPRPRLFRLREDEGIVNRMGLNNHGAPVVAQRLRRRPEGFLVGANVGRVEDGTARDPVADYLETARAVQEQASYLGINVSCPNTGDGRTFEDPDALHHLLRALHGEVPKTRPWLLKLSPDLPPVAMLHLVDVAVEAGLDGLILTNTTVARDQLKTPKMRLGEIGRGGLSGRPLQSRAHAVLLSVYRHLRGRIPIIGVGGIFSAADAYARIRAGASLVQAYSGLVYQGPTLAQDVHAGLLALMERDGVRSISDVIGVDA